MRIGENSLSGIGYSEPETGSVTKMKTTGFQREEQLSAVQLLSREGEIQPITEVESNDFGTLYSRLSPEETVEVLEDVSTVYADLDGTMLLAGAVEFSPETLDSLDKFNRLGGRVVFVTGKPMTEVMRLAHNTPDHIPLEIVVEKGAYYLTRLPDSEPQIKPLLVTPEMRRDVIRMKSDFEKIKSNVEKQYGIRIVPAGDGQHVTVLSIDIVDPELENDKSKTIDQIKIKDKALLGLVKKQIERWLGGKYGISKFVLVDLGNGNFEIGFPSVDKQNVIKFSEAARKDRGSAFVVGDSGNDESMVALSKILQKLYAGAVVHDNTPESLIEKATFSVRGEGNGCEFLNKIIEAKTRSSGRSIIATNTGPFRKKNGRLELCEGMPLAFYDLIQKIDDGAWIYLGNQDFDVLDNALRGKLVSVPLSNNERQSHYGDISNQTLWPLAHKPESGDPVKSFSNSVWSTYEAVCEHVARGINEKLGNQDDLERKPTVWVQDYQLLAVADGLKRMRNAEDYNIGLYWHIPFPEAQVFINGLGEERAVQVLKWFSDYHMIGFHTKEYEENYLETCKKLGVKPTNVLVQPISVDVAEISDIVDDLSRDGISFEQQELNSLFDVESLRKGVKRECEYVLCGIERCDDTKATIERLEAWRDLAIRKPELFKNRKIVEVIVPSRMEIDSYAERYNRATELIKEINAILLKAIGAEPISHVEKIHQRKDVVAAMAASDKVITGLAKKDGYNMSATETALVQALRGSGSLLISEKIGFYKSLKDHGLDGTVQVLFADKNGAITSDCISKGFERFLGNGTVGTAPCAEGLGEYFATYNFPAWIKRNLEGISNARLYGTIKPFDAVDGRKDYVGFDDFVIDPVI